MTSQSPTTREEAERIAAGLTKASQRALPHIGERWTCEGGPLRDRDAYSLQWGRDGKHQLIDVSLRESCWFYRLTPLGSAVASLLKERR